MTHDSSGGRPALVVVDLGAIDTSGRDGVVWSLPHGGDLDVNLVHLAAGGSIGAHVNDEVDVAGSVMTGSGLCRGVSLMESQSSLPKTRATQLRPGRP